MAWLIDILEDKTAALGEVVDFRGQWVLEVGAAKGGSRGASPPRPLLSWRSSSTSRDRAASSVAPTHPRSE
jgi:hypothetical protein